MSRARFTALAMAALVLALSAGCRRQPAVLHKAPLDMNRVRNSVKELSAKMAPRPAGSKRALETAHWIAQHLAALGYPASQTSVRLPDRSMSANVEARTPAQGRRLVLAAHFDTAGGSSCASDSAAGVALILEIARVVGKQKDNIPLTFLILGAEEELPGPGAPHGFSAHQWIQTLSRPEPGAIVGCIVLDRLGRGKRFRIYHMKDTPDSAAKLCAEAGKNLRPAPVMETVERWFPQMPFEDAGIPTAWVEWWPDPEAHTPADTWDKLDWNEVELAGILALRAALDKHWRPP